MGIKLEQRSTKCVKAGHFKISVDCLFWLCEIIKNALCIVFYCRVIDNAAEYLEIRFRQTLDNHRDILHMFFFFLLNNILPKYELYYSENKC